tara:strand:- start:1425 stop:2156 length:732 start_codon:yes stop_codon:yes gene_type:complete
MSTEEAVEVAQADGRDFVTEADVQTAETTNDRPEWLPEKYNSGEDLAKAYKELESKLGTKEEDIRNSIIEEIQNEAFSERPETVGDYQIPENVDAESATDNELFQWWANHSFENGFSQEEFEQGINMYAEAMMQNVPDIDAEEAKLGDNANARVEAASMFAHKMFSEEQLPAIERLFQTADGVMVMETIMEKMKDGSFSDSGQPIAGPTEQELREMMNDPRYWKDRDPHFVKQVTEGYQQIYK